MPPSFFYLQNVLNRSFLFFFSFLLRRLKRMTDLEAKDLLGADA